MPSNRRIPTDYTGVFYRIVKRLGGPGEEKIFYITFKRDGKKIECKAGRQYRDRMTPARANLFRSEILSGARPVPQEKRRADAARATIAKLWEAYKNTLTNKKTRTSDSSNFVHLTPFHNKIPAEITTPEVDRLQKKLEKDNLSPQTIRHVVGLLRRIIRFAVKNQYCLQPVGLIFNMPTFDNRKTENLTDDQLKNLLTALDEEKDQSLANLMRLALATGMRRGALLGLKWEDLDFERGFIHLRPDTAKSGKSERIPMNNAARDILTATPRVNFSEYVFPNAEGGKRVDLKRFLARIREAAKLPDNFRPLHGLRHVFASRLASSGQVDMYVLQKLLTHNSPEMTQRYAHLADEAMRKAANVAAIFFEKREK